MITWFQPPAMCRVATHQTRLPRDTSSLALNAFRDRASTASMGKGLKPPLPPRPVMLLARTAILVTLSTEKLKPPMLRDSGAEQCEPAVLRSFCSQGSMAVQTFNLSVFPIHVSALLSINHKMPHHSHTGQGTRKHRGTAQRTMQSKSADSFCTQITGKAQRRCST